jgi:hypothetical protein
VQRSAVSPWPPGCCSPWPETASALIASRPSAQTPASPRALAVELAVALALLTGFRLAGTTTALDTFFYLATPGVLSLLVMYVLTNLGAARLLARARPAETVLPILGALVAGYVLARNLWPVAAWRDGILPVLVLVWVLAGVVLTVVVPALTARVARGVRTDPVPGAAVR